MLDNFYFSAYQTAISGCIACIKCELALCPLNKVFPDTETYAALEKIFPLNHTSRNLSDLKWAIDRFGFAVPVGSADIIRRRNKVYWKILNALKTEQKKCQTITDQALAFLLANGIPDEDI